MIEKLLIKSRNAEVSDVANLIIETFKKSSLNSDAFLAKVFADLIPASDQLSLAIKRMKAESELEAKDETRDNAARGVFFTVQAALYQSDETIRSAAQTVEDVLEKYGLQIIQENYTTESGLLISLLAELSKPKLQTAVTAIPGCTQLVAQLQAAQDDFEASNLALKEERGQEDQQQNATELKKTVVDVINKQLIIYLSSMQLVDVETYGSVATTVNQIISENNATVRQRVKKTKEEETQE